MIPLYTRTSWFPVLYQNVHWGSKALLIVDLKIVVVFKDWVSPESTWIFQDVPNKKGRLFTHQEQNNRPKQLHSKRSTPLEPFQGDKYLPCLSLFWTVGSNVGFTMFYQGRVLGVRSAPCVQDFDSERPQPACLQEEMPSPERRTWGKKWEWGWMKGVFLEFLAFWKQTRIMFWRWENCHKCCSVKGSLTCVPWKLQEHVLVSAKKYEGQAPNRWKCLQSNQHVPRELWVLNESCLRSAARSTLRLQIYIICKLYFASSNPYHTLIV